MIGRGNGIYFSHPSGGPCWSRDRGYHHPDPLPRAWLDASVVVARRQRKEAEEKKANEPKRPDTKKPRP